MKAVVFDLDGLMFNTEDVYTLVGTELLRRRGREFTGALKNEMMGLKPQTSFEIMIRRCGLSDSWQELAAESNVIFIGLLDRHLAPMPGLLELLDALERARIPKAIATSSCRLLLEACLSRFRLQPRFSFSLAAEDVSLGKPNPEIYLAAAARFDLRPSELLVLEDSENGCKAAAAAGTFAVAVPAPHSRTQDFSSASLVIESLLDRRLFSVLDLPEAPLPPI
jgi:HAD superfamily hydrolase (TIGR01509 family)